MLNENEMKKSNNLAEGQAIINPNNAWELRFAFHDGEYCEAVFSLDALGCLRDFAMGIVRHDSAICDRPLAECILKSRIGAISFQPDHPTCIKKELIYSDKAKDSALMDITARDKAVSIIKTWLSDQ